MILYLFWNQFHSLKLNKVVPYPSNVLDLDRLTVVLTIVLSQNHIMTRWTGKNKKHPSWSPAAPVMVCCSEYSRHTAVSSSDHPVLTDQGSSTEVKTSAILKDTSPFKPCHFGVVFSQQSHTWDRKRTTNLEWDLPGPRPRHSVLPIHDLVVATHLWLNTGHSTPWSVQVKVISSFGYIINCITAIFFQDSNILSVELRNIWSQNRLKSKLPPYLLCHSLN